MVKIGEIAAIIPKCEIIATVTMISDIKPFVKEHYTGQYMYINLDDGEPITLTVWNDSVLRVQGLQVSFI